MAPRLDLTPDSSFVSKIFHGRGRILNIPVVPRITTTSSEFGGYSIEPKSLPTRPRLLPLVYGEGNRAFDWADTQ
jgi:hypothetical protein